MLTTAVFELVQLFYHATEIGNVANAVRAWMRWSAIAYKIKAIVLDKVNCRGTQS